MSLISRGSTGASGLLQASPRQVVLRQARSTCWYRSLGPTAAGAGRRDSPGRTRPPSPGGGLTDDRGDRRPWGDDPDVDTSARGRLGRPRCSPARGWRAHRGKPDQAAGPGRQRPRRPRLPAAARGVGPRGRLRAARARAGAGRPPRPRCRGAPGRRPRGRTARDVPGRDRERLVPWTDHRLRVLRRRRRRHGGCHPLRDRGAPRPVPARGRASRWPAGPASRLALSPPTEGRS